MLQSRAVTSITRQGSNLESNDNNADIIIQQQTWTVSWEQHVKNQYGQNSLCQGYNKICKRIQAVTTCTKMQTTSKKHKCFQFVRRYLSIRVIPCVVRAWCFSRTVDQRPQSNQLQITQQEFNIILLFKTVSTPQPSVSQEVFDFSNAHWRKIGVAVYLDHCKHDA